MSKDFQVDDLVWAKMKGYPPWPAKIAEPLPDTTPPKYKAQFVYFFGSKNFAWIPEDKIIPHTEDCMGNAEKRKSASYHNAINEFIRFSKSRQKDEQSSSKTDEEGLSKKVKSSDTGINKESVPEKEKDSSKKRVEITIEKEDTYPIIKENIKKGKDVTPEKIIIKEKKVLTPTKAKNTTPQKKKGNTISNEKDAIPSDNMEKDGICEKESSPIKSGNDTKESQTKVVKVINPTTISNEKDAIPSDNMEKDGICEKESSPIKSGNDTKESHTKVVKVINPTIKKDKNVLTSKTLKKGGRKRPIDSGVEQESSECSSPKNQKLIKQKLLAGNPPSFRITDIPGTSKWDKTEGLSDVEELENTNGFRLSKHVMPTTKKIGFIGLGNIGNGVVNNLLKSGHDVTVWNRTNYKCDSFVTLGAKKVQSPSELVLACDLIFCSVSDPDACKVIIFGERGILKGLDEAEKLQQGIKGYIEMSSIDPDTSKEIHEVISRKGAKYLEAPICGSSQDAVEGTLLILASGDNDLFLECETCFHAMGRQAYFVSFEVGTGAKMSLLLSVFSGSMYAAVAEGLIMAKRLNIPTNDFMSVLCDGPLRCQNVVEKSRKMHYNDFDTITPLKHAQKDMHLTLGMGDKFSQPLPLTAAANEVYKHAILLRYANADVSAVYQGVRW